MNPTMLYKTPGPYEIHGGHFDYCVVEEEDIAQAQADGWSLTTTEALAAREAKIAADAAAKEAAAEAAAAQALADETKPPTRAELEQMAKSLNLPFDGRTSDKKLAKLIEAATTAPDAVPEPVTPVAPTEAPAA